LYESLMRPGDERDDVKKRYLVAMYDKNRQWSSFIDDRLTDLYPSLANMLKSLKRRNYRHAAHLMQNAEACIFIDAICGRLMRERPELPIFTIHDSVLTTPANVEYVRTVILDEFARLNVTPNLKTEDY
jgi:hypothetical protein